MCRMGTNTWRVILVCSYDCRESQYTIPAEMVYAALGKVDTECSTRVLVEDLVRFPPNSGGMVDRKTVNVTREGRERVGEPFLSKAPSRNARL